MMNKIKWPRFYAAMAVATVRLLGSCDAIAEFFGGGTDESVHKSADKSADGGEGNGTSVTESNVSFDNPNIWIGKGENFNLGSTITPANAVVSWSSETPVAASVSNLGIVSGLSAGTTEITVTLKDGGKAAAVSVQVVDFANPINISANWQWDAVFAAISRAPGGTSANNPAVYRLNIQNNFDVEGRITSNITGNYKTVELTGAGNKVTLSSQGSIIRTAANQTYIFDGPTLVGMSGNNKAVVYVEGGSAELRSGIIRDNTITTSSVGSGVYISGGTFKMGGGTISGNKAIYGGGGVYVTNGTFEMSDGTISGNEATGPGASGYGGGVRVGNEGIFNMKNGTITGNIAWGEYGGGGVWVNASGTFTKNDGTIYGEDNDPGTRTHQTDSAANTATYNRPGQNGHAVALSSTNLFYRNGTLGPQDTITTVGVTTSSMGAFEGYRSK
jgi:hypothetical protein